MFGNACNLNHELSQAINEVSARNDNIDTLSNNAATCNLKIYQVVRSKKMDDNNSTWYESEVLNRARKATAKYKNYFNICLKSPPDIAGETGYSDFKSDVKETIKVKREWNLLQVKVLLCTI